MKSKLVVALAALCLLAAGASAASPDSSADRRLPTPVKVVHPTGLPLRFKDATVKLMISLDQHGNARHVEPVGRMAPDLADKLLPIVAQWKFAPYYENGKAVPVRAVLPLTLTEDEAAAARTTVPARRLANRG